MCDLCGNTIDGEHTTIKMENPMKKMYNRKFNVCEKCACEILEKATNADPFCSRCDKEEHNEKV